MNKMEDGIKIETPALKEYLAILQEVLSEKNFNTIVGASIRKGMNDIILKPAKSAIPYSSLKAGVSIIKYKKAKIGYTAGIIARKRDKKDPESLPAGVILRFLEGGTKVREVNGVSRGKIDPRPMVGPIISSTKEAMIRFIENDFGKALEEQINNKTKNLNKKLK